MSISIYIRPLSSHQVVTFRLNNYLWFPLFLFACKYFLVCHISPTVLCLTTSINFPIIHPFRLNMLLGYSKERKEKSVVSDREREWLDVHNSWIPRRKSVTMNVQFCFDYFINFSMEKFLFCLCAFLWSFLLTVERRKRANIQESCEGETFFVLHRTQEKEMVACSKNVFSRTDSFF